MLEAGFKWAIIAVNKEKLGREWLGYIFRSVEDLEKFLEANPSVTPSGKQGVSHGRFGSSLLKKGSASK